MTLTNPVPSGRLTDRYGPRGYVPGIGNLGFHTGDDIAAPEGAPIFAAHNGAIRRKWWDAFANGAGAGGNMVEIQGDDGLLTRYAHMREQSPLSVGSRVTAGKTVIGYVGSTGAATGPHLHFEALVRGSFTDPEPLIKTAGPPQRPQEEGNMQSINLAGKHLFGVNNEFITHYGDAAQATVTRKVMSATDEEHRLTVAQFNNLLDGLGIPREVVRDGTVLNPQSGKLEKNGTWSRGREILAKLAK